MIINKSNKENGNEVWVQVIIGQQVDGNGTIHNMVRWQKLEEPVSLGSIKNPKNTDIIGFKVVNKSGIDIKGFKDMFGGMFD